MGKQGPNSRQGKGFVGKYIEMKNFVKINQAQIEKDFINEHLELKGPIEQLNALIQDAVANTIEKYLVAHPIFAELLELVKQDVLCRPGKEFLREYIEMEELIKSSEAQVRENFIKNNSQHAEAIKEFNVLIQNADAQTTVGYMKFKGMYEEGNIVLVQSQEQLAKFYMEQGQKGFMNTSTGADDPHNPVEPKNNHDDVESLGLLYFPAWD